MNYFEDLYYRKDILKILIEDSLTRSTIRTHKECNALGNQVQEPDFVADLCLYWTKDLITILRLILTNPSTQINITSVFCHQKPLADFGKKPIPEIGDILFVFNYKNKRKPLINSLLLQAKKTSKSKFIISPEDTQLDLYENWPKFELKRANNLSGKKYDIYPKTVTQGAKYLLIDPNPLMTYRINGTFTYGCAIPASLITLNSEFSDELIDFLEFRNGRMISEKTNSTEDWSKMVWDILEITKNKMTKRNNIGLSRFPRNISQKLDGCHFIDLSTESDSFYSDIIDNLRKDGSDKERSDLDNGGGVSTIFIEVIENE